MLREEWITFAKNFRPRDSELLIRSYDTLMGNVYADEGYLWSPYRCISPGMNNFTGIWNWDSAFAGCNLGKRQYGGYLFQTATISLGSRNCL